MFKNSVKVYRRKSSRIILHGLCNQVDYKTKINFMIMAMVRKVEERGGWLTIERIKCDMTNQKEI